jgi:hypothetical protein
VLELIDLFKPIMALLVKTQVNDVHLIIH